MEAQEWRSQWACAPVSVVPPAWFRRRITDANPVPVYWVLIALGSQGYLGRWVYHTHGTKQPLLMTTTLLVCSHYSIYKAWPTWPIDVIVYAGSFFCLLAWNGLKTRPTTLSCGSDLHHKRWMSGDVRFLRGRNTPTLICKCELAGALPCHTLYTQFAVPLPSDQFCRLPIW